MILIIDSTRTDVHEKKNYRNRAKIEKQNKNKNKTKQKKKKKQSNQHTKQTKGKKSGLGIFSR